MKTIETSLLRERFIISNAGSDLTVRANRIACPLINTASPKKETLIIRGQHTHLCLKLFSKVLQAHHMKGSITNRKTPLDWLKLWQSCLSEYDEKYYHDTWAAVYFEGKPIFTTGDHHPLLDMIEKFATANPSEPYEQTLNAAEQAFKQTGKNFSISHDVNIAVNIEGDKKTVRCGKMLRQANKTKTYSFTATLSDKDLTISGFAPFPYAASALSETSTLCLIIGDISRKYERREIDKHSDELKQLKIAQQRLNRLDAELSNLELSYKVKYRPERPNFNRMIAEAKQNS